jgi:malate dehydrogenase (oxaloacetate-decarboxylating)(NADP+)
VPLEQQRILFTGAGVGVGAADLIVAALRARGIGQAEARSHCWFFDRDGLITQGRPGLTPQQQAYAHPHDTLAALTTAVQVLRPTTLIGLSGQGGLFTESVLTAMSEVSQRPVVFAMSNPTSQAECSAELAYRGTRGRAVFASGSPFGPVEWAGQRRVVSQANNAYVFPGLGLGVVACRMRRVTDAMFLAAAEALAAATSQAELDQGAIYPAISRMPEVSLEVAEAVARTGYREGLAGVPEPTDLRAYLRAARYAPDYPTYP